MKESHALHISAEDMQGYVSGTLGESDRERVDAELLHCEQCLGLLTSIMDDEWSGGTAEGRGLPLPDLQATEERVIAELKREKTFALAEMAAPAETPMKPEIPNRPNPQSKSKSKSKSKSEDHRVSWIQRPAWQYTIAASITLLLLASGTLAGFSQSLEKLDESRVAMPSQSDIDIAWNESPSWSEQLVNRTGSWLDGIQASRFK